MRRQKMMRGGGGKINGTIKAGKNYGSGDAGDNASGRGDGRFDEDSGGRDAGMAETTSMETRQRCRTTMEVKGMVRWRTIL